MGNSFVPKNYSGPEGPEPYKFTVEQLRAIAALMVSMGIKEISQDLNQQDSPIFVRYNSENTQAQRLYWRKNAGD